MAKDIGAVKYLEVRSPFGLDTLDRTQKLMPLLACRKLKASSLTQKGLKNVFDEAIKTVLAPADRSGTTGRRKKKNCVIL